MRTNRERARLVHERTAALRREMRARRRRRLNAVCMAACLLLVTGIGALMPMLMENVSSSGVSHASGTASLIAENGALGCILVGLFAFLLGVCVTVLLYRLRGADGTAVRMSRMRRTEPDEKFLSALCGK